MKDYNVTEGVSLAITELNPERDMTHLAVQRYQLNLSNQQDP
jgi:hypothetical protein